MIRFQINIEISPSDGSDFIRLTTERGAVISDGYAGEVGPATTVEGLVYAALEMMAAERKQK